MHAERERAGELFLDARDLPEGERAVAMASVLELLQDLLEAYPDSAYTSALERNIELVERAVEEAGAGE